MEIKASVIKMTESEAWEKGKSKCNIIGRLLVRDEMSKLEIAYFPFLLVEFRQEHSRHIWRRRKDTGGNNISVITIICDGTTNNAAFADTLPDFIKTEVGEEQIKKRLFTEQDMISESQKLAFRMTHKFIGKNEIILQNTYEIYRPYYIAWYGNITEENKARYLPMAADGFGINNVM